MSLEEAAYAEASYQKHQYVSPIYGNLKWVFYWYKYMWRFLPRGMKSGPRFDSKSYQTPYTYRSYEKWSKKNSNREFYGPRGTGIVYNASRRSGYITSLFEA